MLYVNNIPINPTIFPDNTSQVWKLPDSILNTRHAVIRWEFLHEGEFLQLAQLKTLLDVNSIATTLAMPFCPYARQDKDVSNESTFAFHVFACLLNSLNFEKIIVMDFHNLEVLNLIDNAQNTFNFTNAYKIIAQYQIDCIALPDANAYNKYKDHFPNLSIVHGEKERCQLTGKILNITLNGSVAGKNVLVVDDICDGGATFLSFAKLLNDAKSLHLFVSHGIFSKGTKTLYSYYETITTPKGSPTQSGSGFKYI